MRQHKTCENQIALFCLFCIFYVHLYTPYLPLHFFCDLFYFPLVVVSKQLQLFVNESQAFLPFLSHFQTVNSSREKKVAIITPAKWCILLCILNALIPLSFSQDRSFSYASTKHWLCSPLLLGSNVHRIHDETNVFCNLLRSYRMLLKFCFHCWLWDAFLYTKGSPGLEAGGSKLTQLFLPVEFTSKTQPHSLFINSSPQPFTTKI